MVVSQKQPVDSHRTLEELETKPGYAVGCLNLAELYMQAGKKEEALQKPRKCQEMFSQMGMEQWLERIINLVEEGKSR
jgi:hypothetical protein